MFAPVTRTDMVRIIIALAAQRSWKIFQLDVVEKHDIHIKSKSYKLELLGELVI